MGVFPVGCLAGWVELTSSGCAFEGRDSVSFVFVFPASRRKPGRGNLHKYLSDDDLLKENLYNGAYGEFLRACTLRLSWGFFLSMCMSDSVSVWTVAVYHPFPLQRFRVIMSPFRCACLCT